MAEEFGWCDLHDELVDEDTYEWKGCWSCYHFSEGNGFPYVSVQEAAWELGCHAALSGSGLRVESLKGEFLSRVDVLVFFPHQENITLPMRAFTT